MNENPNPLSMLGRMESSYPFAVETRLSDYMGLTFEKMCREYILYYDMQLPFPIGNVGQWWGGNPKTHRQAQIDVVVTSAEDDGGIIGSCKYRDSQKNCGGAQALRNSAPCPAFIFGMLR